MNTIQYATLIYASVHNSVKILCRLHLPIYLFILCKYFTVNTTLCHDTLAFDFMIHKKYTNPRVHWVS